VSAYSTGRLVRNDEGQLFCERPWYIQTRDELDRFVAHLQWIDNPPETPKDQKAALSNAFVLCQLNPAFLAHEYCQIRLGEGGLAPFNQWTPGQIQLYRAVHGLRQQQKPVRVIILKARREGVSTLCALLGFWRTAFFSYSNGLFAAHEDDGATTLFNGMYGLFLSSTPSRLTPPLVVDTADRLVFDDPADKQRKRRHPVGGSWVMKRTVAPGGGTKEKAGKGRSAGYQFLHGSEVAYWDEPEKFWTGASQCVEDYPETMIFLESTANGFGWYHEQWEEASKGWELRRNTAGTGIEWACTDRRASRSDLYPLFLSWLTEPKYSTAFESEDDREYFLRHLEPEEEMLRDSFGASPEQLNWRRCKLYGNKFNANVQTFKQEYPATPHEAFITSGRKVFDFGALQWAEQLVRTSDVRGVRYRFWLEDGVTGRDEDADGEVVIYREPVDGASYSLGIDGSYGKPNGDFSSGQVLRDDSWEQVAVVHGRLEPDEMAEVCAAVGRHYGLESGQGEALAVVETNGPGLAIQTAMERLGYEAFYQRVEPDSIDKTPKKMNGWWTSGKARGMMVSGLKSAIRDIQKGRGLILHDLATITECMGWVNKRSVSGKVKEEPAAAKGYDDRITALGLALVGGCIENGEGAPIASHTVNNPDGKQVGDPLAAKLMREGRPETRRHCHPVMGAFV